MTSKDSFSRLIMLVILFAFFLKFNLALIIEVSAIGYLCFMAEKALENFLNNIFDFGGER